ncbi:MAG: rod-binding protein [Endozoicomonas sp. (ex Botrylloides leachii)]|nr:rod-binding protein [Endozoicomonas sp. (ex Botrylloides leachii)]
MISTISSLDMISTAVNNTDQVPQDLKSAAHSFESLFINEWLKSMRKANEAMMTDGEDNPMMGDDVRFYYSMFDSQLAQHLSSNGGLGIAETLIRQLD